MRSPVPFGERLSEVLHTSGRLCVGIDPHPYLLSEWGLEPDEAGLSEFGMRVVDAVHGAAGIVKPQVAFFEEHGVAGYRALERVLGHAREAGLLVIADAKRGDIGSSVSAYARAWLRRGSCLEADAMTVSAYQGVGSLAEPHRLALAEGKGLFVLAATSNPEAAALQTARLTEGTERSVARAIIEDVQSLNRSESPAACGSVGVVVGATVATSAYGLDVSTPPHPTLPVLAPGFGHQGASIDAAGEQYGRWVPGLIVSESRGLLAGAPSGLACRVAARSREVVDALG